MSVIGRPVNTPAAWSLRADAIEDSFAACGWTYQGQKERHAAVIRALGAEPGDRLLDWGCGTGDLSEWFSRDVNYVGYDSSTGMIIRAAREHPGRIFQSWWPTGIFDLVACVGPFNLPSPGGKQDTWHTIRHLWDTTFCRTLVVSLYSGGDENCVSYNGAECAAAGAQMGRASVDQIRHNDLLLTIRR